MYDNFCIIPGIERIGYPDRCSVSTVALVLSEKPIRAKPGSIGPRPMCRRNRLELDQ
jgi:hypothetical protein